MGITRDIRYALRVLWKSPGFTVVAVLTLALAIGMNTALFSVVQTLILSPLPFPESERLVVLQAANLNEVGVFRNASYPNILEWKERSKSLQDIAAVSFTSATLTGGDAPERVFAEFATANYFSILQVTPALGRTLRPGEDRLPRGDLVAVLGHDLWQRRFGGRLEVLEESIEINGETHTIVGVMPDGFSGAGGFAEVWTPLSTVSSPLDRYLQLRGARWLFALGRLSDGVELGQAQAELTGIGEQLSEEHPRLNRDRGVAVSSLAENLTGGLRQSVWVLFAAVGFVLLIACLNVANLLLARASTRQRDVAIRAAMGAGPGRILREQLVEGLLLSFAGGMLGLLVALWAIDIAQSTLSFQVPDYMAFEVNAPVLGFTALLCVLVTMAASLLPAWRLSRQDPQLVLKHGGRTPSAASGGQTIRNVLVVAELAICLALLVGAGLTLRTLQTVLNQEMGFDASNAVTTRVNLPGAVYPGQKEIDALARQVQERLSALPPVLAASASTDYPLAGHDSGAFINYEGQDVDDPDQAIRVWYHSGSVDFFRVMGIRFVSGRPFTGQETADSLPVAVISKAAAEQFFPGEYPIGKRIRFRRSNMSRPWLEVVGVVDDVRYRALVDTPGNGDPDIYLPLAQAMTPSREMYFSVRAAGDPTILTRDIRSIVQDIDPNLPLFSVTTLRANVSATAGQQRLTAYLLGGFAVLALLLAVVGTYGVISYAVASRTHEFGIRMALGAQRADILRMVIRQGVLLTAAGISVGLAITLGLSRFLAGMLYGVTPNDPTTFVQVALILAAAALLACYVPARRATRVEPMIALRYE